jgi:hypothetical protein
MTLRPLPDDPSGPEIESIMDLSSDEWLLANEGEMNLGMVAAMKADDSGYQELLAIEFPVRVNNSTETRTLRLLLDESSATTLIEEMLHPLAWLRARRKMNQ